MAEKIVVQINSDALLVGDIEILENAGAGGVTTKDLLDLFDRVVIGGARALPMRALPQIIEAIREETNKLGNPTGTVTA